MHGKMNSHLLTLRNDIMTVMAVEQYPADRDAPLG